MTMCLAIKKRKSFQVKTIEITDFKRKKFIQLLAYQNNKAALTCSHSSKRTLQNINIM